MSGDPGPTGASVLKVGILGYGSIGRRVAGALREGSVPGAVLSGVLTRTTGVAPERVVDVEQLVRCSDLVIEVAGHEAVRRHGAVVLRSDTDLLVVSTGALADPTTFEALVDAVPGRLFLCPGAIGGVDLLRAVRHADPAPLVSLTSRKHPRALVQPWMSDDEQRRLASLSPLDPALVAFHGNAREASLRFPQNANVAATVALALGNWQLVEVQIVADASLDRTEHLLEVSASVGRYRFEMLNDPSQENPASSRLVVPAVLGCIAELADGRQPWIL